MNGRKRLSTKPRDPWKRRIGVEFSGLERPTDFLIAIGAALALVIVALLIAFFAFG